MCRVFRVEVHRPWDNGSGGHVPPREAISTCSLYQNGDHRTLEGLGDVF